MAAQLHLFPYADGIPSTEIEVANRSRSPPAAMAAMSWVALTANALGPASGLLTRAVLHRPHGAVERKSFVPAAE
ncbi:hypothetical protein AB5J56_07675 [Streptomyces sp. R21]|uniref:Uncharacterized protein n=1 Tax=Streptomyces sp. R21 TaxID=3238627 RepID=A0AB39P2J3_9ACTN